LGDALSHALCPLVIGFATSFSAACLPVWYGGRLPPCLAQGAAGKPGVGRGGLGGTGKILGLKEKTPDRQAWKQAEGGGGGAAGAGAGAGTGV